MGIRWGDGHGAPRRSGIEIRRERAALVAGLTRSCSQDRLTTALAALSRRDLRRLLERLPGPVALNSAAGLDEGLCSESTTGPGGVVVALHKEA